MPTTAAEGRTVLAIDSREVEDPARSTRWRCTLLGTLADPGDRPGTVDCHELVMCLGGGPFAVLKLREGELADLDDWQLLARIAQELRDRDAAPGGFAGLPPLGAH